MKKYMDIERLKTKYESAFTPGEWITVTEKVDGANASFTYDPATDSVIAFSRKNQLNEANNLRGFWNWTQRLDKDSVKRLTENGRYVVFGEWLVKHTISYPDHRYNNFYMFDMWDTQTEHYVAHETVWATFCGLEKAAQLTNEVIRFVPIFYTGEFKSWEHLYSFVGKTEMDAEPTGEGVVIKSQDRLEDTNERIPKYLKIVAEKFSEVHKDHKKPVDPEELKRRAAERDFVATIATERRAAKLLEKMIDEGELREDWDETDMSFIAKTLPKRMYEDCRKEEPETVLGIENFGKVCGTLTMGYVKNWLKAR